jgi:hypothetical protein
MRVLSRRAFALFLLIAAPGAVPANDIPARPLPEARPFLEAVRDKLKSDQTLLSEYTFLEEHVQTKLDAKGAVKSTKRETYEVYPSSNPGRIYRRLVAVDGKPIDPKDLAEADRKQEERTERRRLARENETPEQQERRRQRHADNLRKEKAIVEELFEMDDIRVVGREMLNGRSTVVVTFRPRAGFKPQTKGGKVLQKIAGQAWIDEEDQELVRIDAELLDGLGVGPGGVFRLQKGAHAFFERRRVNGEIWLPAEARFTGAAKVLLFVLGRMEARSSYSDYRKVSVSTTEEVSDVEQSSH